MIKKLQDIAWDMWDHRNGILHGDPDRHHRKGEVEQADANIVREWQRGDAGLLQEDRFLFRNPQEQVLARTLELKWQWLTSVTGARAAADAASRANDSYSVERQGMRNFLAGRRTRTHETNNTDTQDLGHLHCHGRESATAERVPTRQRTRVCRRIQSIPRLRKE